MLSILLSLLFPRPPSLYLTAMSAINLTSLAYGSLSDIRGKHLDYFKLASFFIPSGVVGARAQLVTLALAVHFFKRLFEVLFIHQYSGRMLLDSAIPIAFGYFVGTVNMTYAQYLSHDMAEPALDLKYPGIILFLVGIAGNFYHHYLLSKLRAKGDKGYKIPRGGLFDLVICPHYLFEIIGFYGFSFLSQTVFGFCFALGTTFYLVGRSSATRKWYLSKFENFPRGVKALIPYVF